MGKFGGFGGGMGNMQQLMRQAQKMQQDMAKAKEELAQTEVTAVSGGGMVEVTMTCEKKLVSIKIKPEAVDPDDVEMLEDLIIAAVNEAQKLADDETEKKMGPLSGFGL
ncbi:MAG TPA: YbaB/EbfC family nucleoid-associated protein [Candidatus Ornithoclostridium excrementipullorum]|nr:YbaB/EbfC family nucleoid-associated protein [Candidatus Ornithoclostridium excrementipullorum]